jgi:hypothetical protein
MAAQDRTVDVAVMGARTPANEPYHENAIGAAIDWDCPREQRRVAAALTSATRFALVSIVRVRRMS